MRFWALFCFIGVLASCKSKSPTYNPDDDRLTCIVPGYDSVIYYTGGSSPIRNVKRGVIYDTMFIQTLFKTVKDSGFLMVLKIGDGGDVLTNYQQMTDLMNEHAVIHRSIDTLDEKEERAFGYTTPPMVKDFMRGDTTKPALQLNLPRDEGKEKDSLEGFPKASQMVILLKGEDGVYVYSDGNIKSVKQYTYDEIRAALIKEKKRAKFSVLIKPAASCSYKNTVNMLDEMTITNIKHYALVDITKEEEQLLSNTSDPAK